MGTSEIGARIVTVFCCLLRWREKEKKISYKNKNPNWVKLCKDLNRTKQQRKQQMYAKVFSSSSFKWRHFF